MKKKLLSVMLVGALAISALTGCGSKETASDDSQKTGTTTPAISSKSSSRQPECLLTNFAETCHKIAILLYFF